MKTVIRPETEMKDSGIEWIGNIPNDWKVSRVGNFFSFSSGDSLTNEDIRDDGMYLVYGANGIRGYYFKYNLDKKRILLGRVGALAGNVHIVDEKVWVTEHALIASDKLNLVEEYYGYVFESMNLIQYSKSSAQPVISGDTLQKLRFPVPELSEQQAIADYLDETCSKIDEIIAEAKASIEEYKELKQSILFETMTRGIQSDRKYKTCDYEWLGKVPEDWSLMKITHILDDNDSYPIGDGDHGLIKTDSYKSEGIPYIRVQNIGWGTPLLMDNVVYISKEDNERIKGSQLKPGDVLFVKTGATIGKTAIVPNNIPTFIIDFVNTKEDILKAFQPFYQETSLAQEINTDLIYKTQRMLRAFKIYDDADIEKINKIYFDGDKRKANKIQAAITNALLPIQQKYNALNQEQRYQFRKLCRTFVKWYGYITQIARMFDKQMHNEYIFCSYLAKVIPADPSVPFALGDRVKLEYYNLEKTFEGSIDLVKEEKGIYESTRLKKPVKMEETLSPLEQVIEKINEQYMGNFTEGDKVVITTLHQKLKNNKKLVKSAQTDGRQIFEKNIFPQLFDDAAQEAYSESIETYTKLFEDAGKYRAIMGALAHAMFEELQQRNI